MRADLRIKNKAAAARSAAKIEDKEPLVLTHPHPRVLVWGFECKSRFFASYRTTVEFERPMRLLFSSQRQPSEAGGLDRDHIRPFGRASDDGVVGDGLVGVAG